MATCCCRSEFAVSEVQMAQGEPAFVQPVTIAYTRLHGMPMGRQHRVHASWIGDRVIPIWSALSEGGVDVDVHFHEEPIDAGSGQSRKALASQAEQVIADQLRRSSLLAHEVSPPVPSGRFLQYEPANNPILPPKRVPHLSARSPSRPVASDECL